MSNHLTLYMPPARRERLRRLAAQMDKAGVPIRDNRGNISLSKALDVLMDVYERRARR